MEKSEARSLAKLRRKDMTEAEVISKSEIIQKKVLSLINGEEFKRELALKNVPTSLYTYIPVNNEVRTYLINDFYLTCHKKVLAPKVIGKNMSFYEIKSVADLSTGSFNIPEPKESCAQDEDFSGIMIVPGVAFDRDCVRVGYGGGFYDRYLQANGNFVKIALAYDCQIFDHIEKDDFDIKPDFVVTESDILMAPV